MKKILNISIILWLISCKSDSQKKESLPGNSTTNKLIATKKIDFKDFKTYKLNPCDTFSIEVMNIYPLIDTLPRILNDTLYLDNYLENIGFVTTKTGWGNWAEGPRIIENILVKKDCHCKVYKKYQVVQISSKNGKFDGHNKIKITEKIVCNALNNGVE